MRQSHIFYYMNRNQLHTKRFCVIGFIHSLSLICTTRVHSLLIFYRSSQLKLVHHLKRCRQLGIGSQLKLLKVSIV